MNVLNILRVVVVLILSPSIVHSQLSLPPSGDNQKSEVTQYMGLAKVTISYSSPGVKGRVIWGNVVAYGLTNFNAGKSSDKNPSPWRAGANENTVITLSHDLIIEGKPLKAGVYGMHMIPDSDEWIVIFSSNSISWGSFFYTPDEDVLRVRVKPEASEFNEWLSFTFTDRLQDNCTLQLKWEHLTIPLKLQVPNGDQLYVLKLRDEFLGPMGFQGPQFRNWHNWVQAANFCALKKINLDEAQTWLENYLDQGIRSFRLFESKANILSAKGQLKEANALMMEAVNLQDATVLQITNYGRSLISQNRYKEALEILQISAKRYPESPRSLMGLAYGYAALGNYKEALKFAHNALNVESNPIDKKSIESSIKQLESKQNIN